MNSAAVAPLKTGVRSNEAEINWGIARILGILLWTVTTFRYVEKQQLFIVCPLRRLITKIILKSKNCFTKFCCKAEKVVASKLYRRFLKIGWVNAQGLVARSLVSANRWLRGIKMYRFPWYLTLVSTNHASSNPGQFVRDCERQQANEWSGKTG